MIYTAHKLAKIEQAKKIKAAEELKIKKKKEKKQKEAEKKRKQRHEAILRARRDEGPPGKNLHHKFEWICHNSDSLLQPQYAISL